VPVTSADFLENGMIILILFILHIATQFAYAYGYDWGRGAEESKK